jgi:hypothetical protein
LARIVKADADVRLKVSTPRVQVNPAWMGGREDPSLSDYLAEARYLADFPSKTSPFGE